jgi:hypothetical protein
LQPDGSATEGYRRAVPGSGHATTANPVDADYVIFESERFHTSYIAVKVKSRLTYNLEEEQLGFQLLRELTDTQLRVRTLRALASPTAAEREELRLKSEALNSGESFLEYLIGIQRQYGISAYFL